jgi:hypothetical protein
MTDLFSDINDMIIDGLLSALSLVSIRSLSMAWYVIDHYQWPGIGIKKAAYLMLSHKPLFWFWFKTFCYR